MLLRPLTGPIAWKPPILWLDTFGTHTNISSAQAITADSTGLYVQGYVNYSRLGERGGSVILTKYGFDGGQSWMRTVGNTSEIIEGMTVAPDGIFLTGENVMGGIVQKFDKSGNQLWAKQFDLGEIRGISATSTGV